MRLTIVGLGLIGGSIARALRRPVGGEEVERRPRGVVAITTWSPTGAGPRAALVEGIVDRVAGRLEDALDGADLVVLAAPPLACLELLGALGGPLRSHLAPGATVTDVASTKAVIVRRADGLELPFVGGHPMSGREASGFAASTADLFVGHPWVVVPGAAAVAHDVERVEHLARACGALPLHLDAADHDATAAAISHLPLLLAFALVEAVTGTVEGPARGDWSRARELSATGWQDMTRLARGDPAMAAGILTTNAGAVTARLRDVRDVLDGWLAALEVEGGPDAAALEVHVRAVRTRLESEPDGA